MVVKVRGGVMSTDGSTNNVTAIDVDMRDLLRAKKTGLTAMSTETAPDYSSFISGISVRSINEIDHLIGGLQGLREKLNYDGGRLEHEIANYAALNEAVVQLTQIVSDGMAQVNKTPAH